MQKGGEFFMIELFLSSDGKHTVHVSADTPEQLRDLVPAAKVLYREVIAEFEAKCQAGAKAPSTTRNGHTNGQATVGKRVDNVEQAQAMVAPLCPVHQTQMVWRNGHRGPFWSCHTRKPDGHWCNVTYDVTYSGNGTATITAA
jgi:hypothetical protein